MLWYGMYGMHKALKRDLDGFGSELPQPLSTTGRINTMNTTGTIDTTAGKDYVEAGES